MRVQEIQTLYRYSYWATARILRAAAGVPPEQFATAALGTCQMRDTLAHMVAAEHGWRLRWQGTSPRSLPGPQEFPTLESIQAFAAKEQRLMLEFIGQLSDERLQQPFEYTTTRGVPCRDILWQSMLHVVNHGTQHRSELALLLTELGCSPGDLDIVIFIREQTA